MAAKKKPFRVVGSVEWDLISWPRYLRDKCAGADKARAYIRSIRGRYTRLETIWKHAPAELKAQARGYVQGYVPDTFRDGYYLVPVKCRCCANAATGLLAVKKANRAWI